jgi:hypothetical protein
VAPAPPCGLRLAYGYLVAGMARSYKKAVSL